MSVGYQDTRNADPNNPQFPQSIREIDRKMIQIGFTIDLGSYRNGHELDDMVNSFVDVYGWEIRQVEALNRETGEPIKGFTTIYGKG